MAGNLLAAINQAQSICWNENYGYRIGGTASSYVDGVDCSGLIGRVLHDNGFNYPSYHVGTIDMVPNPVSSTNAMGNAGFQIITPESNNPDLNPGDIVVLNHLDMTGGHTFIYMENLLAYTDPGADSDATGIIQKVKVEASSSRGETAPGDHRKNGTGAYWEVWVHAYASLWYGYDIHDPNDHIRICRWPGGLNGLGKMMILKRIRDGQFPQDNWTNKFFDIGI